MALTLLRLLLPYGETATLQIDVRPLRGWRQLSNGVVLLNAGLNIDGLKTYGAPGVFAIFDGGARGARASTACAEAQPFELRVE